MILLSLLILLTTNLVVRAAMGRIEAYAIGPFKGSDVSAEKCDQICMNGQYLFLGSTNEDIFVPKNQPIYLLENGNTTDILIANTYDEMKDATNLGIFFGNKPFWYGENSCDQYSSSNHCSYGTFRLNQTHVDKLPCDEELHQICLCLDVAPITSIPSKAPTKTPTKSPTFTPTASPTNPSAHYGWKLMCYRGPAMTGSQLGGYENAKALCEQSYNDPAVNPYPAYGLKIFPFLGHPNGQSMHAVLGVESSDPVAGMGTLKELYQFAQSPRTPLGACPISGRSLMFFGIVEDSGVLYSTASCSLWTSNNGYTATFRQDQYPSSLVGSQECSTAKNLGCLVEQKIDLITEQIISL